MRCLILMLACIPAGAEVTVVRIDTRRSAPTWAVLQRHLIETMNRAGVAFVKQYTRPDGSLIWKERYEGGMNSSDDAYEAFRGLSMHYVLGGSKKLDRLHRHVWDGVTMQFTRYGQVYREFDGNWDWMHHGEGYTSFYPMGMADPGDKKFRDRAVRFAAMFTGEDPESPNYDPQLKLMRSVMNGSRGPKMEWNTRDWIPTNANLTYYQLPFDDIPGVKTPVGWINDDQFEKIVDTMSRRMARGDVPINLTATPLIANAFLYTGEEKYRRWVRDYVGKWVELTKQNKGITPDNVGLSGKIGEYTGGNWWGGYYGWKWPRGGMDVVRATNTAAKVAMLLTGDASWLSLPRSQMEAIRRNTRMEDGFPNVAMRHDQRGWHHYQPEPVGPYIDLWYMSQDARDWAHIERLAAAQRGKPSTPELGWIAFLKGENPSYPEQAFRRDLDLISRKLARILDEHGNPETWVDSHWSALDPIPHDNLIRLSVGGLPIDLRGEMLHARLRYFDAERREPGLPPGVAALVTKLEAGVTEVELINTDLLARKQLLIQGGAYGEHQITEVSTQAGTKTVNGPFFRVNLAPGAGAALRLSMKRYANQPTYTSPWSRPQ